MGRNDKKKTKNIHFFHPAGKGPFSILIVGIRLSQMNLCTK